MKNARRLLAVASLFLLTAQTPVPHLGESIEVSIVNVDVHVTDKQGNRVRGLTKDDFEIYEGGKLQPISNFAEYSSIVDRGTARADGPAVEPAAPAPRQKRTIAVFLERMKLADFQVKPLVGAIKDVLRKSVEPGDVVSIVIWDRFKPTHVGFTGDLAPIEEALDTFAEDAGKAQFDEVALQRADMLALAEFEARVAEMAARADGGFGGARGGGGGGGRGGEQAGEVRRRRSAR